MRQPVPFGKYLLLDRIAVGGMAEVFAAKAFGAEGFTRIVAIKKILPTLGEDPEFVSMFVDEARIAVQLAHENVVQVLELGKHDESLYIAMEYISGRDVRQLLDRYRKRGEPMPLPQACAIAARVCDALDYAHRKTDAAGNPLGIVHRDVSPQNVLVSFDGLVKLIDFGIAKAEKRLQQTQSGILKGKFSYMSPEQVRGELVDRRSDVFASGVLLWELICGRRLFGGESDIAVLEKVRNADVPPPATVNPKVPKALSNVVLAALAANPRDRYQSCGEMHDDLLPFAQEGGTPIGSRQLAAFLREEFRSEYQEEQARMRRWLGAGSEERVEAGGGGGLSGGGAISGLGDAVPGVGGAVVSAGAGSAEVEHTLRAWRIEPDGDTLVRPPTPTGRTIPREALEPQQTRILERPELGAPDFDTSKEPTGARRGERNGALTRPRKDLSGPRGLVVAVGIAGAVVSVAATVVGYVTLAPRFATPAEPQRRPVQVEATRATAGTPPAVRDPQATPASERAEATPAPAIDAEVAPAAPKPAEVAASPANVAEVASAQAKVAEVAAAPAKVAEVASAPAKVADVAVPAKPAAIAAPAKRRARPATEPVKAAAPEAPPKVAAAAPPVEATAPAAARISAAAEEGTSEAGSREPRLHVVTDPTGAEIKLGGKSIGHAPLTTDPLEADREYELSASLDGYLSARRTVRTGRGATDVMLRLPIQPVAGARSLPSQADPIQQASALIGYLVTSTRPAARVTIDGRATGRWTPVPEANPIALPAGTHQIVFETADGKRHEEVVQIEAGTTSRISRDLRP
jgi:hypothetical protein